MLCHAVQGRKITPPTQNKRGVLPPRSREEGREFGCRVLGMGNASKPTRFNHNRCNATKEVRDMSLTARAVNKLELVGLQELKPSHLPDWRGAVRSTDAAEGHDQ